MAKKKDPNSNVLSKTCKNCKRKMQRMVTVTKPGVKYERDVCTCCGQRDVIETVDKVK